VPGAALVVLGCGFAGAALARRRLAAGGVVRATVRREAEAAALRALGVDAVALPTLDAASVRARVAPGDDVAVCFPPDGETDARVCDAAGAGRAVVYVSTTGVYGDRAGRIDEDTLVDLATPKARARAAAEDLWRAQGATVLRAAGIYGVGRGLHRRVLEGSYRVPEGGARVVSRIHVDDLATLMDACLARPLRAQIIESTHSR
jgi:nucleoside-diphosphate-sugar epimerase